MTRNDSEPYGAGHRTAPISYTEHQQEAVYRPQEPEWRRWVAECSCGWSEETCSEFLCWGYIDEHRQEGHGQGGSDGN